MTSTTPGPDGTEVVPAERPTEPFRQVPAGRSVARPSARWSLPDIADEPVEETPGRRVRGMPNASAWQRSHAVWHRAGVDWIHGAAASDAPADPAANGAAASIPAIPAPIRTTTAPRSFQWRPVAIGAAAVLAVALGGFVLFSGGGGKKAPAATGAASAEQMFVTDPAAKTDGLVQELTGITTVGGTTVVIGAETGGPDRGRFLASVDGGRTWQVARVRAADGGEPRPGEAPRFIAGGPGAWAALGGPAVAGSPSATAVWVSADGRDWTRHGPATDAAFTPQDRVLHLARTANGFVAVGVTGSGKAKGVVWSSADGRSWQRIDRPALGDVVSVDRVAAVGSNLLVRATTKRSVTKTERKKGKTQKVTRIVRETGFWRSTDGGRAWKRVTIPQAQGSSGVAGGLVAGPGGFYVTRDGRRTTGPKKRRKTTRFAVVFSSADGAAWTAIGQIGPVGFAGMERLSGSPAGLAALVRVGAGKLAVMRSPDGKTWQRVGEVAGPQVRGLVALPAAVVVAGRRGEDPYLSLPGAGDIDLSAVPGAVRPERTVSALVPDGPRLVAVGSTNGAAAAWAALDGRAWARATGPSGEQGRQRLTDAGHGAQGWVAVGRSDDTPLVLTSADGGKWQKGAILPDGGTAESVAYGPRGYVAVGRSGPAPAAWHSADLKTWTRWSTGGGWLRDVASVSAGYVAVGGQTKAKQDVPAVWTSPDGKKWTPGAAPSLPQGMTSGAFTRIAARGGTLVAYGSGVAGSPTQTYVFVAVSADGGKTWQSMALPGAPQGASLTAVTATPKGFVVAGAVGEPGRRDVALWASPDGRSWRSVIARGDGLDGPGDQRLTALAVSGNDLVAIGTTGDHGGETPTFWRTALP